MELASLESGRLIHRRVSSSGERVGSDLLLDVVELGGRNRHLESLRAGSS